MLQGAAHMSHCPDSALLQAGRNSLCAATCELWQPISLQACWSAPANRKCARLTPVCTLQVLVLVPLASVLPCLVLALTGVSATCLCQC